MNNNKIGVTERGDPALDHDWLPWVRDGKPTILITKNCIVIEKMLDDIVNPNVIVQCNITGWGGTDIEPNVPEWEKTVESYKSLSQKYGEDHIVLRIDPVIPTYEGLGRALSVAENKTATGRVRISFLDAYPHVRLKFRELGRFIHDGFHAPLDIRQRMWEALGKPEVCAEPGLPSSGCLSAVDCEILGVKPSLALKGQRPLCMCLANKFELLTKKEPCPHGCVYCYWKG